MMIVILAVMIFLTAPLLAVLIFALHTMSTMELDRPPTKEEWKEGKRQRTLF